MNSAPHLYFTYCHSVCSCAHDVYGAPTPKYELLESACTGVSTELIEAWSRIDNRQVRAEARGRSPAKGPERETGSSNGWRETDN